MTTIDESQTAKGYTPAASVPLVYGQPRTIKSITIHHWGLFGQTHDGVVDFFVNGPGATSAHFVASAGRINCLVNPADAAWHAGNATGNATSIGIECRPEGSDGDYSTVAELVRYLRAEYGAGLPLIPHRNWQATACPGIWDLDRLDALAAGTIGAASAPTPTEEDDMAISDDDAIKIANTLLRFQVDKDGGGKAMLLEVIASSNAVHDQQVKRILEGVAAIVKASPGVDSAAIQAALEKAVAGLSITLTAK